MSSSFLPFNLPEIDEADIQAVTDTLRSGWLTTGPKTRAFEAEFAKYVGAKHAIAVNSCTAALHLALEAVGLREGDEVLVPAMTFAATAEVVLYFKAKPVIVDCRPDTLNMDPEAAERAVTPKTRAVIPVHFAGLPCDMNAFEALCRRRGLRLIEDAAHSLPARYKDRMIGSIGDITCFSFYATKTITTGEGGMVTTESAELADRMRLMSLHGISRDAWKRYTADGSWYYEILQPGFKYNLTDLASSLGLEQLRKSDRFWEKRRRYAALYDAGLRGTPGLRLPAETPGLQHAWHLYVVQLEPERLTLSRDELITKLKELGIGTSVHFIPLHLHPYYRDSFGYRPEHCPNATRAYQRVLSLPLYTKMTEADLSRVIEAVDGLLRKHSKG